MRCRCSIKRSARRGASPSSARTSASAWGSTARPLGIGRTLGFIGSLLSGTRRGAILDSGQALGEHPGMELQTAWQALDRDDFRAAEAAALEALAADPGYGEALYLLGSTRLFEGRHREALGPLSEAASRLERRGVRYRLAHCYLALGDYARAEQALRLEARDYPDSANAHNTLGVALVSQSRHEEALSALLEALRIDPHHVEANSNAGGVLHKLERDDEAVPYLRRALAAQPDLLDPNYN